MEEIYVKILVHVGSDSRVLEARWLLQTLLVYSTSSVLRQDSQPIPKNK